MSNQCDALCQFSVNSNIEMTAVQWHLLGNRNKSEWNEWPERIITQFLSICINQTPADRHIVCCFVNNLWFLSFATTQNDNTKRKLCDKKKSWVLFFFIRSHYYEWNAHVSNRMKFELKNYVTKLVLLRNWVDCGFSLGLEVVGSFDGTFVHLFKGGFEFWCDLLTFDLQTGTQSLGLIDDCAQATFTNGLSRERKRYFRNGLVLRF